MGDAALRYAARGFRVFPCQPRGKAPLLGKDKGGNGFHDATTDAETIRAWWEKHPTANIGIATGHDGIFVVDIDKPEADKWLADMQQAHGALALTVTTRTT